MTDIPAIDISKDPAVVTGEVEAACREIGFMYIRGHGIAPQKISRIRQAVIAYFDQPIEDKLRDLISRDNYRGYIPEGFFSPNTGDGDADRYEGYKLHFEVAADDPVRKECDLYGPNKWPDSPPGFDGAVLDYWNACDAVATKLLGMLAAILGVEQDCYCEDSGNRSPT
ncbi:MAG: hypothetical protein OEV34_15595 [Gammaproteobacteria bacterium]|nr:hypothetical protein [Gammaproteobacteria bacterium]